MNKYFVLGINGSPKKNSRTKKMLDKVLTEITKLGAEIQRIDLCD